MKRFALALTIFLVALAAARAQINVTISLKQRLYILHEPIVATVTLQNLTGRDITLEDTPNYQWFGFRITGEGDSIVAPRNPHYHLGALPLKSGETVKRNVDLNELYALGDFGIFRVQATVFYQPADKFFSSRPTHIELTEGRLIWTQIAGVPEGQPGAGHMRAFSLLAHQQGEYNLLYARVQDKEDGTIYGTYPLGRMIDGVPPQAQFDAANNLYVLHLVAQKSYLLTVISPDGTMLSKTNYGVPKARPYLRKLASGELQLVGGKRIDPAAAPDPSAPPPPKLSDRPPGLLVK